MSTVVIVTVHCSLIAVGDGGTVCIVNMKRDTKLYVIIIIVKAIIITVRNAGNIQVPHHYYKVGPKRGIF